MINVIRPDYISLTTQQIGLCFSVTDVLLATASALIFCLEDRKFLVTNWHNVAGRNPLTGKLLNQRTGAIPDLIVTYARLRNEGGNAKLVKIPLYLDNNMSEPAWFVHPDHKEKVDVVAIEIIKSEDAKYYCINNADFDHDILPEVGDDVFVIGYPFAEFRYLGLPIWKRASIATEPTVNEEQLPKLLIDTATRPGLSGSPVIYQRIGVHRLDKDGSFKDDTLIGRIRGFLGVYSGRIGAGELGAQLGIVWKAEVIEEIIAGGVRGTT